MSSGLPMRPSGVWATIPSSTFSGIDEGHLGGDEAGRDGVDPDVVPPQLARPGLRHDDHAGLGGGVVGLAEVAVEPDDGGGVEDRPAAAGDHVRRHGAGAEEDALEVDRDHGVEVPLAHLAGLCAVLPLDELGVAHDAGVVDQHVDPPPALDDLRHGGLDGGGDR